MSFARGQIFVLAEKGPYSGKPRPALLIQAEALEDHDSLQFCVIHDAEHTTAEVFFRVPVSPTEANGLSKPSIVAVDKIVTARRERVGALCGTLEEDVMGQVNAALVAFQGVG